MTNKPHPGITMHKITFGGGFIGLLFTAGCSLIFLLGFPTLWYFVALSIALGLVIALLFHFTRSGDSHVQEQLSILRTDAEPKGSASKPGPAGHAKLCAV